MCEWGDDVLLTVPIPAAGSHTGEFRWAEKGIDRCLAPYVQALNDAGLFTAGCCCGHGKGAAFIGLHDGTMLTFSHVEPDTIFDGVDAAVKGEQE